MENMSLKKYEETKKEIALEIINIFKSKNLTVAMADDIIEYTKNDIHRRTYL